MGKADVFWFAMNGGGTHHGTVVKTSRSADAESAVSFENIPPISRRAACSRWTAYRTGWTRRNCDVEEQKRSLRRVSSVVA
jgi:hypothetical protein